MKHSFKKIGSPEFLNLQPTDISPLVSKADIKVMYVGSNRNRSIISKEVADEMAKSLRGSTIVAYWKEDKNDFGDHGMEMTFDDEGVHFNVKTVPYGFVSLDAPVWYQDYQEIDGKTGEPVIRKYMMTNGYLWTGQFEEAKQALLGKGQSMELDDETLRGTWSKDNNDGIDYFIINDAIFSKLCILGDDVEPCFEGASIAASNTNFAFSNNETQFKRTLFSMMQDLEKIITPKQGGEPMEDNKIVVEEVTAPVVAEPITSEKEIEQPIVEQPAIEEKIIEEPVVEPVIEEPVTEPAIEEPAVEEVIVDEPKPTVTEQANQQPEQSTNPIVEKPVEPIVEAPEAPEAPASIPASEFAQLKEAYDALKLERDELFSYKEAIEEAKKDDMIYRTFAVLSDEDKKDVIDNKSRYTLDEIEAKLSVICVRNKVNLDLNDSNENQDTMNKDIMTYNVANLNRSETEVPAYIQAMLNRRKQK